MEKECVRILLRGTQPMIICPARSIDGMRIPIGWRKPIGDGRLLLLSLFGGKVRRTTADLAYLRNRFVAAIADKVLIAHAAPGSKTAEVAREVLAWGKAVLVIDDRANQAIVASGAEAVNTVTGSAVLIERR